MGANLSYPDADLSGKVALVTGGNTGIGYETAKALARLGAHTFIACRSKERAEQAIERMIKELSPSAPEGGIHQSTCVDVTPEKVEKQKEEEEKEVGQKKEEQAEVTECKEEESQPNKDGEAAAAAEGQGEATEIAGDESTEVKKKAETNGGCKEVKVEYISLDLASFQSTKECVRIFKERDLPLHILVNNAAVAWIPFSMTDDGYEMQLQVNHLGPMLLTLELLPLLVSTAESCGDVRVCFVSSRAHSAAQRVDMTKFLVTREEDYSRLKTYPNTKLYNIMVGAALQRRLEGVAITVSSPEPGTVKTELSRGWADLSSATLLTKIASAVVGRTPAEGAATSINCVVNPRLNSRQHFYYSSCKPVRPDSEALDKMKQEALWKKSIEILKDHLSQDVMDKYGATMEEPVAKETPAEEKSQALEATAPDSTEMEEPVTSEPTTSEPVQSEPATSEPVTSEPTVPDKNAEDAKDETATADSVDETAAVEVDVTSKEQTKEDTGATDEVTPDQKDTPESLPEEPMKERAEEQEINPPGNEEEPNKEPEDAGEQIEGGNTGNEKEETN